MLRRFEVEAVPYFVSAVCLSLLPGVFLTLRLGTLGMLAYDGNCYAVTGSIKPSQPGDCS